MKTYFHTQARMGGPQCAACRPSPAAEPCARGRRRSRAFSLIEIMVTVGLLSFIILGLLAMFSQTQKAFRTSMTQTDVLEAGRSLMDMLAREVEQAAPTHYSDRFIAGYRVLATNFFVESWSDLNNPLIQDLPGSRVPPSRRPNHLERFFFLSKLNQDWIGTGYVVVTNDLNGWVGTLYRYSVTNSSRRGPFDASGYFRRAALTNMSRIADGVVHLRIRPFSASGFPILADPNNRGYAFVRTNAFLPTASSGIFQYAPAKDIFTITDARAPEGMFGCYFVKDAVPAFIEVELGILEPQLLQRYKSIPIAAVARQFLSDHVGQVHIFRQRIPIRNVDVSVYP